MAGTDTTWAAWQAMDSSDGDTDYHSIEDLVNGTTYTFQVRAVNPTGDGPSSGASAAVIPAGPPAPPEVTVGEGHEKVVLSWTPGDANGSAIQRHELRYSGDGGTTWNPDWRDPFGALGHHRQPDQRIPSTRSRCEAGTRWITARWWR